MTSLIISWHKLLGLPQRFVEQRFSLLGALLLTASACNLYASDTDPLVESFDSTHSDLDLIYYSDYFSFVGKDDKGTVSFALDNNRGQDGNEYQAEHFVVLHYEGAGEKNGWHRVVGNGAYPNPKKELTSIPDSKDFQFSGDTATGFTIKSASNHLEFKTNALPIRIERKEGQGHYWMSSAEATVQWHGRRFTGRVIYEFLVIPEFNRLSRIYDGLWKDFHGVYLTTENGGDVYLHSQESPLFTPVTGRLDGFYFEPITSAQQPRININSWKVVRTEPSTGSYQWPLEWIGKFSQDADEYDLELDLHDRSTIADWGTGGFSMGILKGELKSKKTGETLKVFGIGEILL